MYLRVGATAMMGGEEENSRRKKRIARMPTMPVIDQYIQKADSARPDIIDPRRAGIYRPSPNRC